MCWLSGLLGRWTVLDLEQFFHCLKCLSMPSVETGDYLVRFGVNAVNEITDGRRGC
jgi:hypothetical protein